MYITFTNTFYILRARMHALYLYKLRCYKFAHQICVAVWQKESCVRKMKIEFDIACY